MPTTYCYSCGHANRYQDRPPKYCLGCKELLDSAVAAAPGPAPGPAPDPEPAAPEPRRREPAPGTRPLRTPSLQNVEIDAGGPRRMKIGEVAQAGSGGPPTPLSKKASRERVAEVYERYKKEASALKGRESTEVG